MSLKQELHDGTLNIDVNKPSTAQVHHPALVSVKVEERVWAGMTRIVSLGPDQFGLEFPIKEDGSPLMAEEEVKDTGGVVVPQEGEDADTDEKPTPKHVDFKEALKESLNIEFLITENALHDTDLASVDRTIDAVSFVAEVVKLRDDLTNGQVLVRYATLNVVGWREELDFEPPEITLPKEPFAHAGEGKKE